LFVVFWSASCNVEICLASEEVPELADIRIVRGPADLDPVVPAYVTAFLNAAWS
jgi:hypothetical protein